MLCEKCKKPIRSSWADGYAQWICGCPQPPSLKERREAFRSRLNSLNYRDRRSVIRAAEAEWTALGYTIETTESRETNIDGFPIGKEVWAVQDPERILIGKENWVYPPELIPPPLHG